MSVIPIDKSIAQRCAVLGLDFDKSNIGKDIKNTLSAAEKFGLKMYYSKNAYLSKTLAFKKI